MGLRIIRLGCLRFTIEHWSYQIVRLQGTTVFQIFLFAFCDRAYVQLNCSPSWSHIGPTFFSKRGRTRTTQRSFLDQIQGETELGGTNPSPEDNGMSASVLRHLERFFRLFVFVLLYFFSFHPF